MIMGLGYRYIQFDGGEVCSSHKSTYTSFFDTPAYMDINARGIIAVCMRTAAYIMHVLSTV